MKKQSFLTLFVVLAAVILTASMAQAWDRQKQFTFRTPDGGFVQHNDSSSSHLLGSDTWQSTQTHTPVSNVKRTRETETESKSWTRMNLDPRCNNEKAPLTDRWFAQRERNLYEDQGTEVVGANSGGNPSLLNVLLPAAFSGSVAATSGGAFYYAGQRARKAAKVTFNGGNATNAPGPTTATTGPQTQTQTQAETQTQTEAQTQTQ